VILALVLSACSAAGDAAPVVKIGLIAPFEGLGRASGYTVLPVIQDAITAANSSGAFGEYRVGLVALNDGSSGLEAAAQAQALALDPEIVAVLGPWSAATAETAAPVLTNEHVPVVLGAPAASIPGSVNVCPHVAVLADVLLARAVEGRPEGTASENVAIAGPENALASALGLLAPAAWRQPSEADSAWAPREGTVVIHTGDAEAAARDLVKWRGAGWEGALLGGPDMAQPWFGDLAGAGAQGALALACSTADDEKGQPLAIAGQVAADSVLAAIASSISNDGRPTRAAIAEALAMHPPEEQLQWRRFSGRSWRPELSGSAR
jgi:hypothetical protein